MELEHLTTDADACIRDAMESINRGLKGITIILGRDGRLVDVITDGDIRRAILAGMRLDAPVAELLSHKRQGGSGKPVTADCHATRGEILRLMQQHSAAQVPLVDDQGCVVRLVTLSDLVPQNESEPPVQAVIMAGGFGSRLKPLTDNVPKPMLPIGGTPLMEQTVHNLRQAGVRRISVTTHYLPEKITQHFGDGRRFGVELSYVSEGRPLGTAGSLSLLEDTNDTLLVMNGDILTHVDYRSLLRFHRDQGAELTVGVRRYDLQIPFGVIQARDGLVQRLDEKPKSAYLVNAGIYVMEPSVRRHVPSGRHFDMTELIERLLKLQRTVACFPIVEYWIDIGQHDDFRQAQEDANRMKWAA